MVLLYLGPNTVMPLASLVAVLVGVILIFWRFALGLVRGAFRVLFRRKDHADSPINETPSDPHS
jgi:predicted membrane protein